MSLEYCIAQARLLARPSKGRYRLFACITDHKGRIIAASANLYKTHPLQKKLSVEAGYSSDRSCLHAELAAIIASKGRGSHLYVARVGRSGEIRNAAPCKTCRMGIELHGGIKSVTYTN